MASEPNHAGDTPIATAGPPVQEAGGVLTIDLDAIAANYRIIAERVMPGESAAVVKADAYGCGIERVVPVLLAAGCKTFFVAHLAEARRTRAVAPDAIIYVLNGFLVSAGAAFAELKARPVINSLIELAEWDNFIATSGFDGLAALHVDTGMNRLGLTIEEAAAVAASVRAGHHRIALLMSHFACADRPGHPLNEVQIGQFRQLRSLFRGTPSSIANSSGIFLDSEPYCDIVRPGVALYGGNPHPDRNNPMRPVIELKAQILQVRNVVKGASIGYGATFTARRDSRIAVISAGYADGLPRASAITDSGKPREAMVAGRRCPIVGRLSMDLTAINVTDVPPTSVRRDQAVTLIGEGLSLDDAAAQAGTISYELLTGLGPRYHRVWKGGLSAPVPAAEH